MRFNAGDKVKLSRQGLHLMSGLSEELKDNSGIHGVLVVKRVYEQHGRENYRVTSASGFNMYFLDEHLITAHD